ncbi:hypothetical protein M8J77_020440 [Diaphorina citri]|nr:hypothetical protein M8J77_020440 [Diaphorina citri]
MAAITTGTNFCMKWQNFQVHLAFELYQLLKMESMVDVTLKAEGEAFQAHRIILSASSPFFQEILSPIENDCHPIVILADVPANDVKAILEFIYYGEIKVEGANIFSVLKTAQNLKISALLEIENHLMQNPICTSTINNEIEVSITTPPNKYSTPPKSKSTPKKPDRTKVLGQPTLPQQDNTKKTPSQPSLPVLSTNLNSLNVASSKTSLASSSPSKSNSILPSRVTPSKTSQPTSQSLFPIVTETKSPPKVPTKRPLPPLEPATSSKTSSLISSNSFTSIESPLSSSSFSKSIFYSDPSYDTVISKPLAELQPDTNDIHDKFSHKDGSDFIALEGLSAGLISEDEVSKENHSNVGEVVNPVLFSQSKNTEVHVVQFDGLEAINEEENPLAPWLTLKPPIEPKDSSKESQLTTTNTSETNDQQFFIVGLDGSHCSVDEFFMSVDDGGSVPVPQPEEKTIAKADLINQAIEDIATNKKTISDIVNTYNIPRSTIYYRAKSSGIKIGEKYNKLVKDLDDAVKYVKGGATLKEACDKYGVAKTVLWRRVNKELGHRALTARAQCKSKYSQTSLENALLDLKNGINLANVCKKYNIPPATLHRARNRLIDLGHLSKEKVFMPRYNKDMTKRARLLAAVRAVQDKEMTTTQASLFYKVPKVTLWRKLSYLNKMINLNIKIEEMEMDSFEMEEEEDEDEVFMLPPNYQEEAMQDEEMMILMMEEESQEGTKYMLSEEENSSQTPLINTENSLLISDSEEVGDAHNFLIKTEPEDEMTTTSYILVNNDMCLKI